MKSNVLRKRFMDTAGADVLRAVDGGAIAGSMALALCVIDYLAYLRPKVKSNTENYKRIVRDYLVPIDARYVPTEIYACRCSLIHTYRRSDAMRAAKIDDLWMTYRVPNAHLNGAPRTLTINMDTFVADIVFASAAFFRDTDGDVTVENHADDLLGFRTGWEFVAGHAEKVDAWEASRDYGSMHPALAELDCSTPNLDRLREAVTNLYPTDEAHVR